MKRLLFVALILAGKALAEEVPFHWEYFEPEVDYTRRLRVAGATENWEIVNEPTPDKTGPSLKLTFQFSKQKRSGVLVFDLPPIAFDRISFRIWNPNPPTLPIYLHLSAFQATSLGAFRESISFISSHYGSGQTDPKEFLKPGVPSAPLPSSQEAGWITYEVKFPRDIVDVVSNGKHRPPSDEETKNWKNYALPAISLMFDAKPAETSGGPATLYIDDVEFFLSKSLP